MHISQCVGFGGLDHRPNVRLVCSNRPRAQVQSSHAKWGGAGWNRDTHHATLKLTEPLYEGGAKTLCGRDCSEWLTIENNVEPRSALLSGDLCLRCAAKMNPVSV